jgi:hypothetical protein
MPATTLPMPRSPAAIAPCQASGAAASVIRAACTDGTSPCSAMATRQAFIIAFCASVGPVSADQQPEVVGEVDLSDQVGAQVMPAHRDRSWHPTWRWR